MLLKEYDNVTDKYKFVLALKNDEFICFLNKFYGSLIFRGRKSFADRMFTDILFNLKKKLKNDPFFVFSKSIDNILPLFSSSQRKMGKNFQSIPSLAVGKRRYVILLDWIIRKQKGKSNVVGLRHKDISNSLIDAFYKRGNLIRLKEQYYKTAMSGKHLLLFRKKSKITLKGLRRKLYKKEKVFFGKKRINVKKKKNFFDDIFQK